MITLNEAKNILTEYGQEHILAYYDELSPQAQADLLYQIERVDFSVLDNLDRDKNANYSRGHFEPLGAVTIEDIAKKSSVYKEKGLEAIRSGKVAAVMLAGGQGTRLGFDKPKGMFNIGKTRELFIFECQINNMMKVVEEAGAWIPLYIMTSQKNFTDTTAFFEEKNYFGYNRDYVSFFIQDMAPSVDCNGKIYMEGPGKMAYSPNGNGGWFSSMARSGHLDGLKARGIEWINVFAVDNVLQQIADPMFIGAVLESGCESGGKVVSKAAPDERVGVLCLEDGKPSIVEYYEMTEEMRTRLTDDGELAYKFGVILNYLFKVSKLEQIVDEKLPFHVVKKKIPYMDENRQLISPAEPNGYKFETLVLDMVHQQSSCLPYEVERNREFAPIKNAEGVDSVITARALLEENGIIL